MDAVALNRFSRLKVAQFPRRKNIPHLLSCIAIDSFFLHAIAFELSGTCCRPWRQRVSGHKDLDRDNTSGKNDPLKDQIFRSLRTTLHLPLGPQKILERSGLETLKRGIPLTYHKDVLCLKGIAYSAEAA